MLKKSVLVMFVISMLFMMSCTDDPTGDNTTSSRITDINEFSYNPLDSTWVSKRNLNYTYENDRIVATVTTTNGSSGITLEDFSYSTLSDVMPLEFSHYEINETEKTLLDSLKFGLTYEDGKTKEVIMSIPDPFGIYHPFRKMDYHYENGMLVSGKDSIAFEVWMENGSYTWTYSAGRPDEFISEDDEKIEYVYTNDLLTEKYVYEWSGTWVLGEKEEFTYDNGVLIEKLQYLDNGGILEKNRQYLYTYDGNYPSVIAENYWVSTGWRNSDKTDFEYDGNRNMISMIEYYWNSIEVGYIPDDKIEFIYEEASGNYRDIFRAMNPELFYTGMSDHELPINPLPTKAGSKMEKVLELLDERR